MCSPDAWAGRGSICLGRSAAQSPTTPPGHHRNIFEGNDLALDIALSNKEILVMSSIVNEMNSKMKLLVEHQGSSDRLLEHLVSSVQHHNKVAEKIAESQLKSETQLEDKYAVTSTSFNSFQKNADALMDMHSLLQKDAIQFLTKPDFEAGLAAHLDGIADKFGTICVQKMDSLLGSYRSTPKLSPRVMSPRLMSSPGENQKPLKDVQSMSPNDEGIPQEPTSASNLGHVPFRKETPNFQSAAFSGQHGYVPNPSSNDAKFWGESHPPQTPAPLLPMASPRNFDSKGNSAAEVHTLNQARSSLSQMSQDEDTEVQPEQGEAEAEQKLEEEKPAEPEPPPTGRLHIRMILYGKPVETFVVAVILLNSMFLGLQMDYVAKHPYEDETVGYKMVEYGFFIFFWAELLSKLIVDPEYWANGSDKYWNYFDAFLMVSAALQLILDLKSAGASALRVLRMARLMRIAPIIKTNRFFKMLRAMLYGCSNCLKGLFWAGLLLFVITYLFSIMFLGAVTNHIQENEGDPSLAATKELYGTLALTLRSLFLAVSGGMDWFSVSAPLFEISEVYGLIFICYIWLVMFGMMNVLTGVFVDMAMDVSKMDADIIQRAEDAETFRLLEEARELFKKCDDNGNGYLSMTELQGHVHDPCVKGYFRAMGMDTEEAVDFFHLTADTHGDEEVNIEKLIVSCTQLLKASSDGHMLQTIVRMLHHNHHRTTTNSRTLDDIQRKVHELHGDMTRSIGSGGVEERNLNRKDRWQAERTRIENEKIGV